MVKYFLHLLLQAPACFLAIGHDTLYCGISGACGGALVLGCGVGLLVGVVGLVVGRLVNGRLVVVLLRIGLLVVCGRGVGLRRGVVRGRWVGLRVVTTLGRCVGRRLGVVLGRWVGLRVATTLGRCVGRRLGVVLGRRVGLRVVTVLGLRVGLRRGGVLGLWVSLGRGVVRGRTVVLSRCLTVFGIAEVLNGCRSPSGKGVFGVVSGRLVDCGLLTLDS